MIFAVLDRRLIELLNKMFTLFLNNILPVIGCKSTCYKHASVECGVIIIIIIIVISTTADSTDETAAAAPTRPFPAPLSPHPHRPLTPK